MSIVSLKDYSEINNWYRYKINDIELYYLLSTMHNFKFSLFYYLLSTMHDFKFVLFKSHHQLIFFRTGTWHIVSISMRWSFYPSNEWCPLFQNNANVHNHRLSQKNCSGGRPWSFLQYNINFWPLDEQPSWSCSFGRRYKLCRFISYKWNWIWLFLLLTWTKCNTWDVSASLGLLGKVRFQILRFLSLQCTTAASQFGVFGALKRSW